MNNWAPLKGRLDGIDSSLIDPYLRIADGTGFADHLAPTADAASEIWSWSVELVSASALPPIAGLTQCKGHETSRFVVARGTLSAYQELVGLKEAAVRVQLAQPIRPQRPRPAFGDEGAVLAVARSGESSIGDERTSSVLLGMIDNGCPFAHQDLRRGEATRVIRLWDQNAGRSTMAGLGSAPAGFGYGTELKRTDLDRLMQAAAADGKVDEDRCYRLAGYRPVQRRATHGAHSLGLMAGARRWDGRPNARRDAPVPPVSHASSTAASADIAFVQLPQELMDAVSVASLEQRTYDGLCYLWQLGRDLGYERVIVSFGYESWVGPHDGSSWFESAVAALVAAAGGKLQIQFIAGNSKARGAHVAFGTSSVATVRLAVPPDCEVPTFVEIWVPSAQTAALHLTVTPPGAAPLPALTWGCAVSSDQVQIAAVLETSTVLGRDRSVVLLRIAPTRVDDAQRRAAPHGLWSFRLSTSDTLDGIHAYVGRAEADLGSPRRAHQASFIGRDAAQSDADRRGTLNGHACGQGVQVVGAYYAADFPYAFAPHGTERRAVMRSRSTPYSGAGPSNDGSLTRPHLSLPVEDGLYHVGVLSAGTRSASVLRLSGTSTAAPLWSRCLANGVVAPRPKADPPKDDPGLGKSTMPAPVPSDPG